MLAVPLSPRTGLLLGLLLGPSALGHPAASGVRAEIVVDATTSAEGTLAVRMRWTGLPEGPVLFRKLGHGAYQDWSAVQFTSPAGPLEHTDPDGAFLVTQEGEVEVRYLVAPGGLGRHGHQGYVDGDFAVFDGRIFLVPVGGVSPAEITVRFELPEGWSAATPWAATQEGFRITGTGVAGADQMLEGSCVGLGALEVVDTPMQGLPLRTAVPSSWPDKTDIQDKTAQLHRWFQDRLGFHLPSPYTVVWTDRPTESGVFGGSFSNGTCFERPTGNNPRNWELLAHRYAHAMNRYHPSGMQMRDLRDRWFDEGLAGWAEIRATSAVGLVPDESRWNILHRRHGRVRARHPEFRVPLAAEPTLSDPDLTEYVHYTLAPLAVRVLEARMAKRSGVAMEDFVRHLYATYGHHQGVVPLREELEAFTGDSYADFWQTHVDRVTEVPPVWPEAIPEQAPTAAPKPPVAFAGGRPVSEALLRSLAQSGQFTRYGEIRDHLVRGSVRLADLERRGIELVPPAISVAHLQLPGAQQMGLLGAALDYPIELAPPAPSRGCRGPDPLPEPSFMPQRDTEVGAIFAGLLQAESEHEFMRARNGVDRLAVRLDNSGPRVPDVLTFAAGADVNLFTQWGAAPGEVVFELLDGETVVLRKTQVMDPTWLRTFTAFPGGMRPPGHRILTFRVSDGEGTLAERAFWQHASP